MSEPKHFVDTRPPAPDPVPTRNPMVEASRWRLAWWKFRRHKLAMTSGLILAILYLLVPFAEQVAPYDANARNADHIYSPPQRIRFFHEGRFIGPFVYGYNVTVDLSVPKRIYTPDTGAVQPLRFFCQGAPYRFWGLWPGRFHLVCPAEGGTLFLLGTDRMGRDVFSRIVHGARISLTVGIVGIAVSFVLGLLFGGLAGYFGGLVDGAVQRLIEILRSIPELPLWMALSAALPATWSPILIYFGLSIILGLLDWPGLARAVRSKFMALREEDYVQAAVLMGASPGRVIGCHMVPNFMSHLIASATLSIPAMILGETALSFLGLGLRPPVTSWGILLTEAQNLSAIELYPWLLAPVAPVVVTVLAFNFLGDGLRDAADPRS